MFDMPWRLLYSKVRGEGGREIDRFLDAPIQLDTATGSEAWVASDTKAIGANEENPYLGCSRVELPDGSKPYLFEMIQQNPQAILGSVHEAEYGSRLGILVKLLDAKNSYLLQSHPSRTTARDIWGFPYGKQECWYILSVRPDASAQPSILLGFKTGITRERFEALYRARDLAGLEGLCHRIYVKPGETYFIPDGMPHALGAGCFVVELQESSDLTAIPMPQHDLMEYRRKANPNAVFTEIDNCQYERRMLETFKYQGYEYNELLSLTKSDQLILRKDTWGDEALLIGKAFTNYFSCTRMRIQGDAALLSTGAYRIALVIHGEGTISNNRDALRIKRGDSIFIPFQTHGLKFSGNLEAVLFNPASGIYEP